MALYSINYSCSVTPIETDTLANGTTNIRNIDSLITKAFSSGIERNDNGVGTPCILSYTNYNTTASNISVDAIRGSGFPFNTFFLFVQILSANLDYFPNLLITFGTGGSPFIRLVGIGDFAIIPINLVDAATIYICSSNSYTSCNCNIVTAGYGAAH